jgi:hypothetical protein
MSKLLLSIKIILGWRRWYLRTTKTTEHCLVICPTWLARRHKRLPKSGRHTSPTKVCSFAGRSEEIDAHSVVFPANVESGNASNLGVPRAYESLPLNCCDPHSRRSSPATLFELLKDYINHSVAYNSVERQFEHASICTYNTRERVLNEIRNWAWSNDDRSVCWLQGPAGAGKSTIAQTIAQECDRRKMLAFSYFFSRRNLDRNDMKKFFPTFAFQLATALPSLQLSMPSPSKPDDLNEIQAIPHQALEIQLGKLVVSPLGTFLSNADTPFSPMIAIIDGLDEYDEEAGKFPLKQLIRLLAKASTKAPFRILFTSRPEARIKEAFNTLSVPLESIALQDFPARQDVFVYLRDELSKVRRERSLPASWPSPNDLWHLANKSNGIFIYASTLVKFVSDEYHEPKRMLQIALNMHNGVDPLFEQVLSGAEKYDNFSLVLGAVVFLRKNPRIDIVSQLLQLGSVDNVRFALRGCLSILVVPESDSDYIRPYHASLLDFVADPDRRKGRFFDPIICNQTIIFGCMRVIMADIMNHTELLFYAHQNWCHHVNILFSSMKNASNILSSLGANVEMLLSYLLQSHKTWMYNLKDPDEVKEICKELEQTFEFVMVGVIYMVQYYG